MSTITIEEEIAALVHTMTDEQKRQLLGFARQMKLPPGISGMEAIRIARELDFDAESLAEMQKAIDGDEETADADDLEDIRFDDIVSP